MVAACGARVIFGGDSGSVKRRGLAVAGAYLAGGAPLVANLAGLLSRAIVPTSSSVSPSLRQSRSSSGSATILRQAKNKSSCAPATQNRTAGPPTLETMTLLILPPGAGDGSKISIRRRACTDCPAPRAETDCPFPRAASFQPLSKNGPRECRQAGILNLDPEWLHSSRFRRSRKRERTTAVSLVRNRCQSTLVQGIYGLNKHRRGRSAGGAGINSNYRSSCCWGASAVSIRAPISMILRFASEVSTA